MQALSQTDKQKHFPLRQGSHRQSGQDSCILKSTKKELNYTGFLHSTKEASVGCYRVLTTKKVTGYITKKDYVADCKGDCVGDSVTHAGNTDKMNMSYRSCCNLGTGKKDTGDVKNDSQTFRSLSKGG